jgi:hypothetical protein
MTLPKIEADVLRGHRATLGAAWRFKLAMSMRPDAGRRMVLDDPWIAGLQEYASLMFQQDAAAAAAAFPLIRQAFDLELDPERRDALKVMVVGDLTIDEAHQRVGIPPAALQAWEAIFFDARAGRQQFAWLEQKVIHAEQLAGNGPLAARLRLAALCGPEGARAVLECAGTAPIDEAERLFRQRLKLNLKVDEALQMPIETGREALRMMKFYSRNVQAEKRWELAVRRLEERCRVARERHQRESLRLQERISRQTAAAASRSSRTRAHGSRGATALERASLASYQRRAAQIACAARAAESPLGRLRWASKTPPAAPGEARRGRRRTSRQIGVARSAPPKAARRPLAGLMAKVQGQVAARDKKARINVLAVTT